MRIVRYEGGGYGKYIVMRHNNGLETIYGHLSKQLVSENREVRVGEPIGCAVIRDEHRFAPRDRLCGVAPTPLMFDFREQDVTGDYYAFQP